MKRASNPISSSLLFPFFLLVIWFSRYPGSPALPPLSLACIEILKNYVSAYVVPRRSSFERSFFLRRCSRMNFVQALRRTLRAVRYPDCMTCHLESSLITFYAQSWKHVVAPQVRSKFRPDSFLDWLDSPPNVTRGFESLSRPLILSSFNLSTHLPSSIAPSTLPQNPNLLSLSLSRTPPKLQKYSITTCLD